MSKLPYYHLFGGKSQEPAIELGEKLKALSPIPVSKILYTASGSEANDTQMKLIWYWNNAIGRPKKKKIISRMRGYHGVTIATASLTALPANQTDFDLPIDRIIHTDCPHHYRYAEPGESEEEFASRLAASLEDLIIREGPETVAAYISEPVMGAGGVIVPPRTYFEKVGAVLKKYDVYWIDDEVICGFWRTGRRFGMESLGMTPDTMSLAKQLSAAYAPIGALFVPEEMYQAMEAQSEKIGTFGHGFTYGGHPLGCAVASAVIDIYERRDIGGHVNRVIPRFQERLKRLGDHPLVGEARGLGLIGAVELVADKATKRPFAPLGKVGGLANVNAQRHGAIVRALGDAVAFCPPLIIAEAEIDDLFDRVERALDDTEATVAKENLRAGG